MLPWPLIFTEAWKPDAATAQAASWDAGRCYQGPLAPQPSFSGCASIWIEIGGRCYEETSSEPPHLVECPAGFGRRP